MGAYAYCHNRKCGAPRDKVTLEELATSTAQCSCGTPYNMDESEKWSAVQDYIDNRLENLDVASIKIG